MSTAEILSLISVIAYVVAGVCFALAVFFWFFFKIPSVVGDLSGRTAKKSIAKRRESNERASARGYRPSATNLNRGKVTDPIKPKVKTPQADNSHEADMPETGLLDSNRATAATAEQTELLNDGATELLVNEGATELLEDAGATAVLTEEPAAPVQRVGGKKMTMLEEIMLIHTDEVIA